MFDFVNRINDKLNQGYEVTIYTVAKSFDVSEVLPNDYENNNNNNPLTFLTFKTTTDKIVDIRISDISSIVYNKNKMNNGSDAKKFYDGIKNATKR